MTVYDTADYETVCRSYFRSLHLLFPSVEIGRAATSTYGTYGLVAPDLASMALEVTTSDDEPAATTPTATGWTTVA